ncbi:thiamine-phosphate kinase [Salinarimonas ramus]|uniref:Thiamine-monophosphate kinase n=1 Tax=Salinarimonas ramus TaxID=690164 RepID=A0A917V9Z2_9HYPH|nr:thiamine-phosphate kinase [Salinarimonas ramus]GGK54337.1 thiamine-monophosphate kinase [Salinarimonas ramus]
MSDPVHDGDPTRLTDDARLTEDGLIARFFAPIAGEGAFGLRDDAARIVPGEGMELVVTLDTLVAGVHFFPDDPPGAIGRKALGVNVSDLASKGAEPRGFLLSAALPQDHGARWLGQFAAGLKDAAEAFRCPLLGGDTVKIPGPLTLSVTAFGETPRGAMVHRFDARPGDRVVVTGTIGDSALGLLLRTAPGAPWTDALGVEGRVFLTDRYLHPRPRLAAIAALRAHARAAMDVSDGLAGDLAKMCRTSGVSAEVDVALVPLSDPVRAALAVDPTLIDTVLTGGDDYEILCAVPDAALAPFLDACDRAGLRATAIGTFVERNGEEDALPVFRDGGVETRYASGSYSHF